MNLYILIGSNGDGSYSNKFILDPDVLMACEENFDDCETHPGVDGDGFHYTTIKVPDNSTPESLGLSKYSVITKESLLEDYNISID